MDRGDGSSERLFNRRSFARLAAGGLLGAAGVMAGGAAFAAEESDARLCAGCAGPDADHAAHLGIAHRAVAGLLRLDRQRRHPGQRQRPGAALLGLGRVLPHLSDLGAADRGDDPARPHLRHPRSARTRTGGRPRPCWRATPPCRPSSPPGPDNPLGVRALNLGWPSYRIHGTNDIRKIGRQSSSGCIGLFNEHILEVYDRAQIGTPVLLNLTTPVIYWRTPLSPIESTRESWLVFEALACPLAGPGELAVSQTRTL